MKRRRLIVGLVTSLAAGVLVVFVIAGWEQILESWYLARLESLDLAVRESARERLLALRSPRAVPRLIASAARSAGEGAARDEEVARKILGALGDEALARVGREILEHEPIVGLRTIVLLKSVEAPAASPAILLRSALRSPSAGLRRYAAEELSALGARAGRAPARRRGRGRGRAFLGRARHPRRLARGGRQEATPRRRSGGVRGAGGPGASAEALDPEPRANAGRRNHP